MQLTSGWAQSSCLAAFFVTLPLLFTVLVPNTPTSAHEPKTEPLQAGGFTISPTVEERSGAAGGAAIQFSTINITNLSGSDALDVTFTAIGSIWNTGIEILPSSGPVRINNGASTQIFLRVAIPAGRPINERNDITFRVFTNGGSNERMRGVYTVVVNASAATPSVPTTTPEQFIRPRLLIPLIMR